MEHRGELARRGEIIDVYPSSGEVPIRIDLWGDEVDRLTTFGVNDQRATADLDEVLIFPARELLPDDDVRARAAARRPPSRGVASSGNVSAEGQLFDGMESWLPWLPTRTAADRRAPGAPRSC